MLSVPNWVLVPAITVISMVGVYSVHSTVFDLVLMVGLGVFGYLLRKLDFPLSALILGFVLGEMMEDNLRRALSISTVSWAFSTAARSLWHCGADRGDAGHAGAALVPQASSRQRGRGTGLICTSGCRPGGRRR